MMIRELISIGLMVVWLSVGSLATQHTVGDSSGWTLGVDYGTWSASKTFLVGDTLVFKYGSGHTVDEVKQSDYTKCIIGNAITSDNKGTTSIILQTPGTHYFICGTVSHCASGMKLFVNVLPSNRSSMSTNSPYNSASISTNPTAGAYPNISTGNDNSTTPYVIPDYSTTSSSSISSLLSPVQGGLIFFVVVFVKLDLIL